MLGTGVTLNTSGSTSSNTANPNPPNSLSLSDLANASTSNSSLINLNPITANVTGTLPLSVNGIPGITIDPSNPPAILLGLATPNDLATFQVTTNAAFTNVLNGFVSNISNTLSAFSDGNVLQAITGIVSMVGNFGPLSTKLPIINKSVNDLVGIANNLNSVVSTLTSQDSSATLISALSGNSGLLTQLNAAIQGLPAAASAIAMAPGYLQTLINQSGQAAQSQFASATDTFNSAATAAEGCAQRCPGDTG